MYWEGLVVTLTGSAFILAQQYRKDLIEPRDLKKETSTQKALCRGNDNRRLPGDIRSNGAIKHQGQKHAHAVSFKSLRNRYVVGFTMMSLADWLQGPFLLPMYASFGLQNRDVAALYAVDYCVGILAGLVAGGLADSLGAKKACVIYGYLYAASCLCNHFADIYMPVVALGCAIDGLCNALLRTSFESWISVICTKNKYSEQWLTHASSVANWFSTLMSLLSGLMCQMIVAAVASLVRTSAKRTDEGSVPSVAYVATMDAAAVLLVAGAIYITYRWEDDSALSSNCSAEDGTGGSGKGFADSLRDAANNVLAGARALYSTVSDKQSGSNSRRSHKGKRRLQDSNSSTDVRSLKAIVLMEVAFEATLMIFIGIFPMSVSIVDGEKGSSMMGVLFVSLMGGILFGNSLANMLVSSGIAPTIGWRVMSICSAVTCACLSLIVFAAEFEDLGLIDLVGNRDIFSNVLFVGLCAMEVCFGFYYPYLTVMHNAYAADSFRNSCVAIVRSVSYGIALCSLLILWLTNSIGMCWLSMTLTTLAAALCSLQIK